MRVELRRNVGQLFPHQIVEELLTIRQQGRMRRGASSGRVFSNFW